MRPAKPLALALALAAAAVVPAATSSAGGRCTPGGDWAAARADLADAVVALVNGHRRARGLGPVAVSPSLTAAAVWKARHMAEYGYMAHDDPAPPIGRSTGERIAACGYEGGGWGENIAMGYTTPAAVMQGWLTSPGHRGNIERSGYVAIGVGAAVRRNGVVYWAQAFGTELERGASPPQQPNPQSQRERRPRPETRRVPSTLFTSRLFDLARRPHAGRRFTVRVAVVQKASRVWVRDGRVRCRARVDGRAVSARVHRFRRGLATCVFQTPRRTRGLRLAGTIRIHAVGSTTARWFSRRIR